MSVSPLLKGEPALSPESPSGPECFMQRIFLQRSFLFWDIHLEAPALVFLNT